MSSSNSVRVSNISNQTSEEELRNFFSFCGKISNLSVESIPTKSATVTFERTEGPKTALLLDNSELGGNKIHVTLTDAPANVTDKSIAARSLGTSTEANNNRYAPPQQQEPQQLVSPAGSSTKPGPGYQPIQPGNGQHHHYFSQSDKPRTRILAEYLAHGYRIADEVIEKAIQFDQKNGYTEAFKQGLADFDAKFQLNQQAKELDDKHQLTRHATKAWNSVESYFDKALGTPTGQKLRKFYEEQSKVLEDVHHEARHLASLKEGGHHYHHHHQDGPQSSSSQNGGVNTFIENENRMEKGECKCDEHNGTANCPQHGGAAPAALAGIAAQHRHEHGVSGDPKAECKCGSDAEHCPCPTGLCDCTNCAKNTGVPQNPAQSTDNSQKREV